MKIAFMTPGTIHSSISYRPLAFAKELVKKGHDVYIFSPRFDKYSNFKDEGITEIEGVKIVRPMQIKTFSFELGLIPYIFSSLFLLHKLRPDVIDLYKATPITIIGLLLKLTLKKRIVFTTDDIDSMVVKIEKQSFFKVKLVQLSEKIIVRYADIIVTGSKYLQNLYSSQYKNKPVAHIPNGAEFTNIKKLSTKNLSTNNIIFIGNINRINILEPLFTAIKKLASEKNYVTAVIIGDGKYLSYFKKLSNKLALNQQVQFLGRIPQIELSKHVKVGDIGYSYMPNETTQKACSNMKVFQYMQNGAVPLVSNVGDLPIYTFNGKAGYIAKHSNMDDLIKTMKEALKNNLQKKEKIQYSLNHASKTFSWAALTTKLEKIYQNYL